MAAPRASIAVSVTRAGLTVATAFALTRVFAGRSWLLVMLLAAIAPPVCLEWARRRQAHPALRLAIVAVVGVWLSALVADPATSVFGVPTRATMASLGHAISRAPHTLRAAVVPVDPTGAALVLAFVGVFVAAALTYWIATSLDAPFGAFAPSIALFIVIAAIGSGGWVVPTALYGLASLGYLLALAQHDLAVRRTWFHAGRPRASRLAAGGIAVGTVALALALIAGPSVPGAGGSPLIDYRKIGGSGSDANLLSAPPPILSIKDKLTLGPETELFTVSAPSAAYWRVIALDWFTDDNAWGVDKATEQAASKLERPAVLPASTPMHQQFHIETLDPHWLPAAYQPVGVNLTAARVVPDSLTLLVDSRSHLQDLVYDVDSAVPKPTQNSLEHAGDSTPRALRKNLELPADFPAAVRTLARQVTAGAQSNFERASDLQAFFRKKGNFRYTTDTDLGDSPDAITEFLTKTKAGFCEQFAASFAAMARAVGVPTRVAVGYQPGKFEADNLFHVTNRNAHAWPEVWFPGTGWIPFEPTPGFAEPTLGIGTGGASKQPTTPTTNTATTQPGGPSTVAPPITFPRRSPGFSVTSPPTPSSTHHDHGALAIVGIVIGVLAVVAAGFVAFIGLGAWRRRRRRQHAADPRGRVLGAWAEALDQLRVAGVPPRPSATALEFAQRYAPAYGAGDAGPALMELAQLQSAAMYSAEPPSDAQATFAWEQVDRIRTAVRHNVARSRRWRRMVRERLAPA